MKSRIIGFAILVAIGLILDQCSSAKRDDSGQITTSGNVSAFEMKVGDCFKSLPSNLSESTSFSDVEAVPCNEGHHWQNYFEGTIDLVAFNEDAVANAADALCNDAAQKLIYKMSAIKYDAYQNAKLSFVYPTYESWTNKGDRSVSCVIGSSIDLYYSSVLD